MALCKKEGNFSATISDINLIEGRFKENDLYIKIDFNTPELDTGAVYLSMSGDYIQMGNNKGRREIDVTLEQTKELGIEPDFSNMESVIGKVIDVYGRLNTKGYYNFYLNFNAEKIIDKQSAKNKLAQLLGQTQAKSSHAINPRPATPVQQPTQQVYQQQAPINNQQPADDIPFDTSFDVNAF